MDWGVPANRSKIFAKRRKKLHPIKDYSYVCEKFTKWSGCKQKKELLFGSPLAQTNLFEGSESLVDHHDAAVNRFRFFKR